MAEKTEAENVRRTRCLPNVGSWLLQLIASLAIHRLLLYPALPPKIDENHPTWLHLQIREFDPSFDEGKARSHRPNISNHEEGSRWTLGFPDAKACDATRLLILEEINKQRSSVESLLAPLLQDRSENSTHCQEE
ncbi:hypothetical protein Acr_15g0011450 [Actinidia rufa]|uniref:Uncharacterized protein n=1 Tax=Actinidia rufa TaxID=165716 RepID=A0A7J0FVT7_9ERIC|nr:hypothetical protein Acr_15g0011450 [Actinidia rufa]